MFNWKFVSHYQLILYNSFWFLWLQLSKEKKTLDDRVAELSSHLAEEEERSKVAVKQKSKLEALVADLEERLRKEQEVETHW